MSYRVTLIGMIALCAVFWIGAASARALAQDSPPELLIHVKTALSIDDAQICAVPNVAWAALSQGRRVSLLFDASAVTSVTRGFGWRAWFGVQSTALDRAALPERERRSLSEQFEVPLSEVPRDYGEYLAFLEQKGVRMYYNRTMALLYQIEPDRIDPAVRPLGLRELVRLLMSADATVVY